VHVKRAKLTMRFHYYCTWLPIIITIIIRLLLGICICICICIYCIYWPWRRKIPDLQLYCLLGISCIATSVIINNYNIPISSRNQLIIVTRRTPRIIGVTLLTPLNIDVLVMHFWHDDVDLFEHNIIIIIHNMRHAKRIKYDPVGEYAVA